MIKVNKAIAAFGKSAELQKAKDLFQSATTRGLCLSVITYNSMIRACVDSKADLSVAEEYMNKLLESDVKPDVLSFNTIMDMCVKTSHGRRLTEGVTTWFNRMLECGLTPSEVSYGTIIHAHAKARDVRGAVKWLSRMEASDTQANDHAYASVILACARARDADRRAIADDVFARMRAKDVKPNIVVYTAMARGAARDGDYPAVEAFMAQMKADGVQINSFFLDSLMWSYVDARPRQIKRLEAAFAAYSPEILRVEAAGKLLWDPLVRCFGQETASQMWSEVTQTVCVPS